MDTDPSFLRFLELYRLSASKDLGLSPKVADTPSGWGFAAGLVRREDGAMVRPDSGEIVKYEPN
jgi:hypothetical protein